MSQGILFTVSVMVADGVDSAFQSARCPDCVSDDLP